MTIGQARLAAFGVFFALVIAWAAGALMAEERMQRREASMARQVLQWETQIRTVEEAYAEEAVSAAQWRDTARNTMDLYLADRERLRGMICIDKALTPSYIPQLD